MKAASISRLRRWTALPVALRGLFSMMALAALLAALFFIFGEDETYPRQYEYEKLKARNGVVLHLLRTTPDNVRLQTIETNVTETPFFGVNGGFFWEGALLSIAVENGRPIKGEPGDYGSGWYNTGVNADVKRGTLVWDDAAKRFSVQVVIDAGELEVTDKSRYWAQGGVSMNLGDAARMEWSLIAEEMPAYDEERMRTALVYDSRQNVYMIVTPTPCTIERFRGAIVEKLGPRGLVDGIYLDGDGSSQLSSKQTRLPGDRRQVFQMLALKR